jgi:hypothetical protein
MTIGVAVTPFAATRSVAFSKGLSLPESVGIGVCRRMENHWRGGAGAGDFGVKFAAIGPFTKLAAIVIDGPAVQS